MGRGGSPWSFRLATVAGIPIRIHLTFFLILLYVAARAGEGQALRSVIFILALFGCVVLHELGHALTARRFGIGIRDITIYPIGGVAMLTGRPRPRQEFWITVAGPAVNLAIAVLLLPIAIGIEGFGVSEDLFQTPFATSLVLANLFLFVFNMIPAFPMDGGRILRSLMAMRMPEDKATRIAGGVGQFLAVALFVGGLLMSHIFLMLIAVFVFLGAAQEVSSSVGYSLTTNRRALDAMMTQFRTISTGSTLGAASSLLLEGSQHDFPVVWEGEVQGVLRRDDIIRGLAEAGSNGYVAGYMTREFRRLRPDVPLAKVLEMFAQDRSPILVMVNDRLLGMITVENLGEFLMLQQAAGAEGDRR